MPTPTSPRSSCFPIPIARRISPARPWKTSRTPAFARCVWSASSRSSTRRWWSSAHGSRWLCPVALAPGRDRHRRRGGDHGHGPAHQRHVALDHVADDLAVRKHRHPAGWHGHPDPGRQGAGRGQCRRTQHHRRCSDVRQRQFQLQRGTPGARRSEPEYPRGREDRPGRAFGGGQVDADQPAAALLRCRQRRESASMGRTSPT